VKALLAVALLVSLAGCAASTVADGGFPTSGRVDYQLGGAYEPADDVTIVARDRSDPPLNGGYSICYVNGFQTQPQEADFWLDEHADLLLRDARGEPQIDPNWPDEMALDTSTDSSRHELAAIVGSWIQGCADDGFQAVEFDNLDSYTRFDGLTLGDNVAFATLLVDAVHDLGLDAGQKNSAELGTVGRDEIGFDFAVSEECFVYDECALYTEVYDNVIDIEYDDTDLDGLCQYADLPVLTIVRDRDLTPGGTFWSCAD
jgi:hypothetical protein